MHLGKTFPAMVSSNSERVIVSLTSRMYATNSVPTNSTLNTIENNYIIKLITSPTQKITKCYNNYLIFKFTRSPSLHISGFSNDSRFMNIITCIQVVSEWGQISIMLLCYLSWCKPVIKLISYLILFAFFPSIPFDILVVRNKERQTETKHFLRHSIAICNLTCYILEAGMVGK